MTIAAFGISLESAAFGISLVSILIAIGALWYAHRADQRADRAERRDTARFAGEQEATEVAALERVGGIMRRELAAAVEATATEPLAPRRVQAAQSRLEQAIAATGIDLPICAEYARTTNARLRPHAERELGAAIVAIRPWRLS